MLAMDAGDIVTIKTRLQFSQSSQPSTSQYLNHAFSRCQLSSQMDKMSQDGAGGCEVANGMSCSQQMLSSQDLPLGSQDYITPVVEGDLNDSAHRLPRSPCVISPNRIKRQRAIPGFSRGSDLSLSQPSQSQERTCAEASTSAQTPAPQALAPSVSRKAHGLRRRQASPECARNVFLHGPPDADTVCRFPKQPPYVRRYRAEYKEINVLGKGNFSVVYKVVGRFDGMEYAAKRSAREHMSDALRKQWQQEAMALAAAGTHANIVRYYSAWTEQVGEGEHFYILMERCEASLGTKLGVLGETFKEAELLEVARQMAAALQHLHARGIVHMDVKPDNIYTTEDGSYKLGDFGLATMRTGGAAFAVSEGDSRYIAQEVLNDDHAALEKADIFALGASLYELAMGTALPTGGAVYQEVRQGKLQLLPAFTASFQRLLRQMMAPDPSQRPSADRVLASPLLKKHTPTKDVPPKENYAPLNLMPVSQAGH